MPDEMIIGTDITQEEFEKRLNTLKDADDILADTMGKEQLKEEDPPYNTREGHVLHTEEQLRTMALDKKSYDLQKKASVADRIYQTMLSGYPELMEVAEVGLKRIGILAADLTYLKPGQEHRAEDLRKANVNSIRNLKNLQNRKIFYAEIFERLQQFDFSKLYTENPEEMVDGYIENAQMCLLAYSIQDLINAMKKDGLDTEKVEAFKAEKEQYLLDIGKVNAWISLMSQDYYPLLRGNDDLVGNSTTTQLLMRYSKGITREIAAQAPMGNKIPTARDNVLTSLRTQFSLNSYLRYSLEATRNYGEALKVMAKAGAVAKIPGRKAAFYNKDYKKMTFQEAVEKIADQLHKGLSNDDKIFMQIKDSKGNVEYGRLAPGNNGPEFRKVSLINNADKRKRIVKELIILQNEFKSIGETNHDSLEFKGMMKALDESIKAMKKENADTLELKQLNVAANKYFMAKLGQRMNATRFKRFQEAKLLCDYTASFEKNAEGTKLDVLKQKDLYRDMIAAKLEKFRLDRLEKKGTKHKAATAKDILNDPEEFMNYASRAREMPFFEDMCNSAGDKLKDLARMKPEDVMKTYLKVEKEKTKERQKKEEKYREQVLKDRKREMRSGNYHSNHIVDDDPANPDESFDEQSVIEEQRNSQKSNERSKSVDIDREPKGRGLVL